MDGSYVYVLQLKNNKWYIGKTNDIYYRIEKHIKGRGSSWTKIHRVINVKEIIPDGDEKTTTLKYMKERVQDTSKGVVRGQFKCYCNLFLASIVMAIIITIMFIFTG